jgi:type I restriction-modification system DNA methylase subunit
MDAEYQRTAETMRRRRIPEAQTTFDTFMGQVEVATDKAEVTIKEVAGDGGVYLFQAKPDMFGGIEVAKKLTKIWTRIYHHAKIDRFFDVTLAVLEHRGDDYMKLIEGLNADVLKGYTEMFGTLAAYFIDGNYSDPLGTFYSEHFKNKMGGEFYTPFNVAYMMAEMLNSKPDGAMLDPCCGSGVFLLATRCVIHKNYGWIASSRYGRICTG